MFRVILRIVHSIFSVINILCDAINLMKMKLPLLTNWDNKRLLNNIKDLKKLEKIPVHLTILLSNEEHSLKDLANMVLWSLFAGISFISFYDINGSLSKAEDKFQNEVNKLKDNKVHVIWHSNHNSKHKNGHTGSKIHVKIFTEKDGRESVAQTTQRFAKHHSKEDITIDRIDKLLSVNYEFPDPDMGIYSGNSFFLYGYPPWQIRITEFFNLKTYHNIDFKTFDNLMCKYAKCDRRLDHKKRYKKLRKKIKWVQSPANKQTMLILFFITSLLQLTNSIVIIVKSSCKLIA